MTEFTADEIRKAADVFEWAAESVGLSKLAHFTPSSAREYAAHLEAEAAAKARPDEHVEELARFIWEQRELDTRGDGRHGSWPALFHKESWRNLARAVLTDGRWVRVEDGA